MRLQKAGAVKLMTPELIATLCDHAQGNPRALMNIADELLAVAAQREARQIDEKLFLETCAAPPAAEPKIRRRTTPMSLLPVEPAYRLAERAEENRWLVTGLWAEQAVGIIGGEPKCCKSFLALDIAVAVAAGIPCLRRFAVPRPGRVLLYAAEDALHIVRRRLEGICAAAGLAPRRSRRPGHHRALPAARSRRRSPQPRRDRRHAAAAPAHPRSVRAPAPHR